MAPDLPGWATKKETSESAYSSEVDDAIDELESGSVPPSVGASPLKRKANIFADVQATKRPKTQVGGLLKSFPRSISDSQVKNSAGPSSRPSPKKNLSMSASANVVAPASKSLTKSSDTAFKPNGLLSQSTASGSASAGPSSSRPTVDKSASSSSFKATGLLRKPRDVDLKTASSRAQAGNRTVDTTRRSRLERQRQRSISSPSPPPSLRKSSPECINISSDSDVPAVTSNSKAKGKEKRKEKGKGKEMDNASSQLPRQRRNSGSVVITDFVPASSQKHSSQRQRKHLKSTSSVSSDDVIDLTKSDGEQDRMNGNARPRPRPSDTKSKPAEFIHILDSDEEEGPVPSARHKVPLPTPSTSSASAPKSNPVSSSAGSSDTLTRPSSNSARSPPTSKSNTPEPMDIDMGMDMDFDNDNDMIPEKDVSVDTSSFLASTSKTISARQASPGKAATPEGRVPEPTLSTSKPTKPESSSQLTSTLHSATEVGPSPKSLTGPQHTSPEAHSSQLHSAASSPRPPVGSLLHFTSAKAANVPALSAPGSPSKPNMVLQRVAPHLTSPIMPQASIASPSEGASSTAMTSRPRPPHTPSSRRAFSLVQAQSVEPVTSPSTSSLQSNGGLVDRVPHKAQTETLQSVANKQPPTKKPSNLFLQPREPQATENPSPSLPSTLQESHVTPESTGNDRPPTSEYIPLPRRRPSAPKASSSIFINGSSPLPTRVLGGTGHSIDAPRSQSNVDPTGDSNAPVKVAMKSIGSKSRLPPAKPTSLSGPSTSRPRLPPTASLSPSSPASTSKPASLTLIDALDAASQTNSRPLFPYRRKTKANGSISVADLNAFRRAKKEIVEQNVSHYLQHRDDPDPREYAHSGKGKQKALQKDSVMSYPVVTTTQRSAFTTFEKGKGAGTGNGHTPDTPGQSSPDELDLLTQTTQDLLASDTHGISNLTLGTPGGSKSATPGTAADEMLSTNTEGMASLSLDTRGETAADLFNDDMDIDPSASSAEFDESTDTEAHLRDDRSESPRLRRSSRRQSGDVSMGSASSAASYDSDLETPARSPTPPRSDVPTPSVFGGYRVKRWADIREDLRHQQPKYLLARDLPSRLHDYINSRPAESRVHPQMRRLFEHEIYINSADTEHDAPDIKVDNSVDDEPCPPWEFYYTNDMWHTEDIPPPTREGLVGCDCVGDCSMNSNCACRTHQVEMAGEYASGDFAYRDGRVKSDARSVPIWECNDMCRCDGHCVNRVVQHGRTCPVKIVKTLEKGWGIFYCGTKRLPEGSFVGIYSGELVTFDVGEQRGTTYDRSGRTYMLDLDFYHISQKYENDHRLSIDAYHAGNFTRFMNHSCAPNCFLQPVYINDGELKKPLMAFFTARDVLPDEELTFSYFGELSEEELKARIESKTEKQDDPKAVFAPCRCGAKMCIGILFN